MYWFYVFASTQGKGAHTNRIPIIKCKQNSYAANYKVNAVADLNFI